MVHRGPDRQAAEILHPVGGRHDLNRNPFLLRHLLSPEDLGSRLEEEE
jgi:hypothetical protein